MINVFVLLIYITLRYYCWNNNDNNNNDNNNFDLTGLNVKKLEIFNRYGKKVYSFSNYTNQWYGQSDSGNELPTGTYYFVIERDKVSTETGWIYINR